MRRILAAGLIGATRRWPVALLLWLVTLLFGMAFGAAAGEWLDLALDASVASRTLAWRLDFNLLGDVFVHHRESLSVVTVVGMILGAVYVLLSVWLNAGVVGAVQDPDVSFTLRQFWWRGMVSYATFVRLWVTVSVLEVTVIAAIWMSVRAANRWLAESPSELSAYYAIAAGLTLGSVALLVLVTAHDHARIFAVRKRTGAWQSLRWASWFVVLGDRRSLLVALTLLLAGGAAWLVYQALAHVIPITSAEWAGVSLLWGQVLMFARALLRVTSFATQTELQAEMPD